MTIQPKIDIEFINQILNAKGKKTTNPFHLNRLDIAISQLEKHDLIEGISARADYLQYINEYDEALNLIDSTIEKFGNKEFLLMIKIKILSHLVNWDLLKKTWQDFFSLFEPNTQTYAHKIYLTHSQVFLDNDFVSNFYLPLEEEILYKEKVKNHLNQLKDLDISLDTYRTVLGLTYKVLSESYSLLDFDYALNFNADSVQFIVENFSWQTDDIKQLYQEVNEAILAIDDVDFQIEADSIEVIFINFPIENLPSDFRLDDDDDSDLIETVTQRMHHLQNNSQSNDREMIKLEVENV